MPLNGVDHVGFTVSDLDRTTAWYCQHELCTVINRDIGGAGSVDPVTGKINIPTNEPR